MKKKILFKHIFLILYIIGIFLFTDWVLNAATPTFVECHGQLRVQGNRIVDAKGQYITLRGMSLYPWADQGLQYYNTTAITRLVNEWKCTVIRVTIHHQRVAQQESMVRTAIEACIANGIYCIINWHCIGATDVNACADFMRRMAQSYGNYPNIMYEPWNEPTDQAWSSVVKPFHEQIINTIRPIDPDNLILCGTPQWCQRVGDPADNPITISSNIAYVLHFYAASHKQWLRDATTYALNKGIAIFCTEYGTCEASGNGYLDEASTREWWNYLDTNGISSANWSVSALSETSAIFYPGTSATNWTDANIKPSGLLVRDYLIRMNTPLWDELKNCVPPGQGTMTRTPTRQITSTFTRTRTATPTNTLTIARTPTQQISNTFTMTRTNTMTMTRTYTQQPTRTFTITSTNTMTITGTYTEQPTSTFTITRTMTRTNTMTMTRTYTQQPTKTFTITSTNTMTITSTHTEQPTETFTITRIMTLTNTMTITRTTEYSLTPTITVTDILPTVINTQSYTVTVTPTLLTPNITMTITSINISPTVTTTQTLLLPTVTFTFIYSATPTMTKTNTVLLFNTPTFTPTFTEIEIKQPLDNIKVYPNPINLSRDKIVRFEFKSKKDCDEVVLRIYTTGCRLVKEFLYTKEYMGIIFERGFIEIQTKDLIKLSNGAYYYFVILKKNGKEERSKVDKFIICR